MSDSTAVARFPRAFPQFATAEDERRHRKQRLAAAFRLFGQFGFDEGVAGHITARDPERLDHFWVNPLGMNFKQVRVRDLILVNDAVRWSTATGP
jgi:ribulose-5-phosphate 4-epimerase/fuculose-1-phosphate aldolase